MGTLHTQRLEALSPAVASTLHPPPGVWRLPDPLIVPTQTLYNKTSEALDQLLQTFLTQNPTADELHFLLSVSGGGVVHGPAQAGLSLGGNTRGCPRGDRAVGERAWAWSGTGAGRRLGPSCSTPLCPPTRSTCSPGWCRIKRTSGSGL